MLEIIRKMVNIKGIIGEKPQGDNSTEYTDLASVIEQTQNEKSEEIHVIIDSIGGDLDMGIAIYEYLRGLGKRIITESQNNCASIAAIIFLAGDTRIAGCPIMIHNPYIENISGDQKTLEMASKWIGEKEKQYEKICAERANLSAETFSALMDNETYISPSQAVSFGFATHSKIIALAKLTDINKTITTMSKTNRSILEMLGLKTKAKAMELTAADGSTLTVNIESGDPKVGDQASPDGIFVMDDGNTITVVNGVITEIMQASAEETVTLAKEEVEELAQFVEGVKAELVQVKEELAKALAKVKSDEESKVLEAVAKLGGMDWLSKQKSSYKPVARTGNPSKVELQQNNPLRNRIDDINETINQKKGGRAK